MSEILKILSHRPDPERIAHAAHLIRAGQVIATPTDTLYGLAADPFNLSAVDSIFRIKGRPGHKPVLLMVNSIEQAEDLAVDLPPSFYKLARKFWPGPLTMVVRASRRMPRKIASETGGIFIKFSDVNAFSKAFGYLTPSYRAMLTSGSVSASELGAKEIK